MTRQNFYETCLMKTFRRAFWDVDNPLHEFLARIHFSDEMTLDEILIKLSLNGLTNIPRTENFKEWGVGYLIQLMGFVVAERDDDFTDMFFSFLKKNTTLYKAPEDRKKLGDMCLQAYTDTIIGDQHFALAMSEFIIFNFRDEDWFDVFLSSANAFGLLTLKAQDEYEKLKFGMTLVEKVRATINNDELHELKEMIK